MLGLLLTVRSRVRDTAAVLVAAVVVQVAWAIAMALAPTKWPTPEPLLQALEAARPAAWTLFWLALLRRHLAPATSRAALGAAILVAAAVTGAPQLGLEPGTRLMLALVGVVLSLACLEQVYRNATQSERWALKFASLAIAATGIVDVLLYSDALLFGRLDVKWWAARAYVHALVAPLVAVSAARTPDWRLRLRVSREVVLHSATLLASGVFLLAVSAVGYGLRFFGGDWYGVATLALAIAAAVACAAIVSSGRVRAKARLAIAKHFFPYRYDYRKEWVRLTALLAAPLSGATARAPDRELASRALEGLANLTDSPSGTLWLREEDGAWRCEAAHNREPSPALPADHPLAARSASGREIVELQPVRRRPAGDHGAPVAPLVDDPLAWVAVPLLVDGEAIGVVVLDRPVVPIELDWEVRDLLTASAHQVASYVAVRQSVERLVEARQFESFSRMSAFVVHDLKNLVAQLSLLMRNATRHRDDPRFQADMLETIDNVVARMQRLLAQLRAGTQPIELPAAVRLGAVLAAAVEDKRSVRPGTRLDLVNDAQGVEVTAHADRLARVVGHLIQNALEATPAHGSVRVVARVDGDRAVVDIVDTGCGMSRDFIESRLFNPFTTTKDHGMGIGAFESREYIREIGGALAVSSTPGAGTTMSIRLPVRAMAPLSRQEA